MLMGDGSRRPASCLSDLAFDEWHAGELDADTVRRHEAHVAACERCRARKDALDASAAAFLERFPSLDRGEGRTRRPLGRARALAWTSGAIAALAVAAGFALLLRPQPDIPTTRLKGGAHVGFFVKQGDRVFPGADGERVHPGDRLRFVASTPDARHLAILSLDAKGVASLYYPESGPTRVLGPASKLPLDSSVLLDDTLGDERVFALFCKEPIRVEEERAALARNRTVGVRPDCELDTVHLVKEAAR